MEWCASHGLEGYVAFTPHLRMVPMVESTDDFASQLLTLPPAVRARLVEVLLASLDDEVESGPSAAIEAAWIAEAERRLAELRDGTVAGVPAAQVFAAVRERLSVRTCAASS